MNNNCEVPRRCRLDLNTVPEISIRNAINEVEKIGADPRLTDVVVLLNNAFELLADFTDASNNG